MAVLSLAVSDTFLGSSRPAPAVYFELVGDPRPQGSKIARRAGNRVFVVESDDHELRSWRSSIAARCREEMERRDIQRLELVILGLEFGFTRPQEHYRTRTGQPSAELKPGVAEQVYARSGRDVDKLTRAVLDALKDSGLYANDRRVVDFWEGPRRVWAEYRYLRVWVWDALAAEVRGR